MNRFQKIGISTTVFAAALLSLPVTSQASSCLSALNYNCTTINDQADNNPPTTPTAETFTQLLGINNAGMVAGYVGSGMDPNHPNKGFVIPNAFASHPTFTPSAPLVPSQSTQTQVFGITTPGTTTVGFFTDAGGVQHGFVNVGGTVSTVDNMPGGIAQPVNQLLGVNDHNMAAGFYTDGNDVSHGYTVNNLTTVPIFSAINLAGSLGNVMATDINNSGEITGLTFNGTNTISDGFLINGATTTLLMFPGSTFTQAFGLNNNGEVVGDYMDTMGVLHGFIYFVNTNTYETLDPAGSTATTLNGINDNGDIVGFFMDGGVGGDGVQNTNGLLAAPVPEPASVGLVGLAALALGFAGRKKLRRP